MHRVDHVAMSDARSEIGAQQGFTPRRWNDVNAIPSRTMEQRGQPTVNGPPKLPFVAALGPPGESAVAMAQRRAGRGVGQELADQRQF